MTRPWELKQTSKKQLIKILAMIPSWNHSSAPTQASEGSAACWRAIYNYSHFHLAKYKWQRIRTVSRNNESLAMEHEIRSPEFCKQHKLIFSKHVFPTNYTILLMPFAFWIDFLKTKCFFENETYWPVGMHTCGYA